PQRREQTASDVPCVAGRSDAGRGRGCPCDQAAWRVGVCGGKSDPDVGGCCRVSQVWRRDTTGQKKRTPANKTAAKAGTSPSAWLYRDRPVSSIPRCFGVSGDDDSSNPARALKDGCFGLRDSSRL